MKNRNYKVWQFDRYERTSPYWELHEIRECNGHYLLVVKIYDANGAGCMFPERFPTFEEAKAALDWFFPGTRALFREKNHLT